jgi:hypothetical protein
MAKWIPLRLIAMMMRVKDPVDLADSKGGKMIQDAPRSEVDEHTSMSITNEIYVADVFKNEEIVGDRARGRQSSQWRLNGAVEGRSGAAPRRLAAPALCRKPRRENNRSFDISVTPELASLWWKFAQGVLGGVGC